VLQSWVDDTGKANRFGLFTLAGFVARVRNWAAFTDEWRRLLHLKNPTPLEYFRAYEAHHRCDQFEGWTAADRDERVEKLARVILKYVSKDPGCGVSFSIPHQEYQTILASKLSSENPKLRPHRNPFYLAFVSMVGELLVEAVIRNERIHLLFDEGIDNKSLLEEGYRDFVANLEKEQPLHFRLLHNKTAEFRDDKCEPPLQAADLLAWHKRLDLAAKQNGSVYTDPIWLLLSKHIRIRDCSYDADELRGIRNRVDSLQKEQFEQIAKSPDPKAAMKRFKKS
jgi:hypothetical protein